MTHSISRKTTYRIRAAFSLLCFLLGITLRLNAQQAEPARMWKPSEIKAEFGDSARYGGMPIFRIYQYRDKGGLWEMVFCEDNATIRKGDTSNTKIKAICLLNDHGGYLQKWEINDKIEKGGTNSELQTEHHIWFWTKYSSFTDIDRDGYAEPIIVYSSSTEDKDVQRLKVITVYKGKKYAVRAIECELDYCRHLRFDAAIKTLPASVQQAIHQLLERIRKEQHLILHEG